MSQEIEEIEGSARQTVALAIRRRQLLAEDTAMISDLALHFGVQSAEHRTCFRYCCGYDFCDGCDDVISWGKWFDKEMDRAGVSLEARTLPYPVNEGTKTA